MAQYSLEEAYDLLMTPTPYSQSTAGAMIRNFGTAAQLMAAHLRDTGASASGAGDAGAATQQQAELHAKWFDQVAANSSEAAGKIDKLVATGNSHQATAEEVYAGYQQAVANDTGPNPSGAADMAVIHQSTNGATTLSAAVDDWGSEYGSFAMPSAPPLPAAHSTSAGYTGGSSASGTSSGADPGTRHTGSTSDTAGVLIQPGHPGSVEVGTDGGDFAGWFKDPRTGYYVDPTTGREFDPVTNRWVDPVTGQPFGDVTQYATGLQGLGGASTSGGLLADTSATASTGVAGLTGGAGGFAGLFSGGNTIGVAGGYAGMLPPSLSSGSAAAGSLWQQAGRSLEVKQQMAANMLAREQAARAGRPYLPPTQAGRGASAGGGTRNRPGYLTAEAEEAGLFSSRNPRRAYLPPTQTGTGKDEKKSTAERRPDWLVDDVFTPEPGPTGVLGD